MPPIDITLYGTEHCHLCEEAHTIINQLLSEYSNDQLFTFIDITDDDSLYDKYQYTIPVLEIKSKHKIHQLNWPFNLYDVTKLLNEHL